MVIWKNTKDSCLKGLCYFVAMPVTMLMPTLLQQFSDVLQDCGMAEVVSLQPLTMEAWVQSPLLFVALGQVFL